MSKGLDPSGPAVVVVDAANVVGSRPNLWWRDRAGAAAALVRRARAARSEGRLEETVVVVLEGGARSGVAAGDEDGVRVVHAPGSGDDAVVEECRRAAGVVTVVTADRGLRRRVLAEGARAQGPGWWYGRLAATA
jgi:hypothetical protein